MSWARLDDRYPQHRKLRAAGSLRPLCIALDVTGICHCAEYATDGFIADAHLPGVLEDAGLPQGKRQAVLAKLVEIGRWHRDNEAGGYWIHDFLAYNPSAETRRRNAEATEARREADRQRKAAARRGRKAVRGVSAERPRGQPPDESADAFSASSRGVPSPSRPKAGRDTPKPPAASPSPAQDAGSAADDPDPRPELHVVAPDRPPPPKLSAQLRAGNGEVPDAAKQAADAALGPGWRERVRPRTDTDPAEFEAERQRQLAAIRGQFGEHFGEHFAAEFEVKPNENVAETEHEVNANRDDSEHGTSTG